MTLKEADEFARKRQKVYWQGSQYKINGIGYTYKDVVYPYIELISENGKTSIRVRPEEVTEKWEKKISSEEET